MTRLEVLRIRGKRSRKWRKAKSTKRLGMCWRNRDSMISATNDREAF